MKRINLHPVTHIISLFTFSHHSNLMYADINMNIIICKYTLKSPFSVPRNSRIGRNILLEAISLKKVLNQYFN